MLFNNVCVPLYVWLGKLTERLRENNTRMMTGCCVYVCLRWLARPINVLVRKHLAVDRRESAGWIWERFRTWKYGRDSRLVLCNMHGLGVLVARLFSFLTPSWHRLRALLTVTRGQPSPPPFLCLIQSERTPAELSTAFHLHCFYTRPGANTDVHTLPEISLLLEQMMGPRSSHRTMRSVR